MKCAGEKWNEIFILNELIFEPLEDSCKSIDDVPIILVKNVLKHPDKVREFLDNGYWWNNGGGDEECARPGKSFDFGPNLDMYFNPLSTQLEEFYDVEEIFPSIYLANELSRSKL